MANPEKISLVPEIDGTPLEINSLEEFEGLQNSIKKIPVDLENNIRGGLEIRSAIDEALDGYRVVYARILLETREHLEELRSEFPSQENTLEESLKSFIGAYEGTLEGGYTYEQYTQWRDLVDKGFWRKGIDLRELADAEGKPVLSDQEIREITTIRMNFADSTVGKTALEMYHLKKGNFVNHVPVSDKTLQIFDTLVAKKTLYKIRPKEGEPYTYFRRIEYSSADEIKIPGIRKFAEALENPELKSEAELLNKNLVYTQKDVDQEIRDNPEKYKHLNSLINGEEGKDLSMEEKGKILDWMKRAQIERGENGEVILYVPVSETEPMFIEEMVDLAESEWGVNISQEQIDAIAEAFEKQELDPKGNLWWKYGWEKTQLVGRVALILSKGNLGGPTGKILEKVFIKNPRTAVDWFGLVFKEGKEQEEAAEILIAKLPFVDFFDLYNDFGDEKTEESTKHQKLLFNVYLRQVGIAKITYGYLVGGLRAGFDLSNRLPGSAPIFLRGGQARGDRLIKVADAFLDLNSGPLESAVRNEVKLTDDLARGYKATGYQIKLSNAAMRADVELMDDIIRQIDADRLGEHVFKNREAFQASLDELRTAKAGGGFSTSELLRNRKGLVKNTCESLANGLNTNVLETSVARRGELAPHLLGHGRHRLARQIRDSLMGVAKRNVDMLTHSGTVRGFFEKWMPRKLERTSLRQIDRIAHMRITMNGQQAVREFTKDLINLKRAAPQVFEAVVKNAEFFVIAGYTAYENQDQGTAEYAKKFVWNLGLLCRLLGPTAMLMLTEKKGASHYEDVTPYETYGLIIALDAIIGVPQVSTGLLMGERHVFRRYFFGPFYNVKELAIAGRNIGINSWLLARSGGQAIRSGGLKNLKMPPGRKILGGGFYVAAAAGLLYYLTTDKKTYQERVEKLKSQGFVKTSPRVGDKEFRYEKGGHVLGVDLKPEIIKENWGEIDDSEIKVGVVENALQNRLIYQYGQQSFGLLSRDGGDNIERLFRVRVKKGKRGKKDKIEIEFTTFIDPSIAHGGPIKPEDVHEEGTVYWDLINHFREEYGIDDDISLSFSNNAVELFALQKYSEYRETRRFLEDFAREHPEKMDGMEVPKESEAKNDFITLLQTTINKPSKDLEKAWEEAKEKYEDSK